VLVDPRNTSQECSRCGKIVKKSLSVRIHHCPHCELRIDRDLNASINILKRARAGPSQRNAGNVQRAARSSRL
jgi:putative transposase